MKSKYHFSVILNMFITILTFMTVVMGLFGDNILHYVTNTEYLINWHYAGIFFAFLGIAFILILIRLFAVKVPMTKGEKNVFLKTSIILEVIGLLSILFVIGAVTALDHLPITDFNMDSVRTIIASVLGIVGLPLHFICPWASAKLQKKASKELKY